MPRIGFQKARYLILSAHAITARNVLDWGLVDASDLLRIFACSLQSETSTPFTSAHIAGKSNPASSHGELQDMVFF